MFCLVDCNSFYASCEQVFRPDLRNKPVVVLSNNDCFIVARSPQAKALGIGNLQTTAAIKPWMQQKNVTLFSSNYPLYGDLSARVMSTLKLFATHIEIYSIDEMFLYLEDHSNTQSIEAYGRHIKQTVYQHTALPVGVGIAPSKTLAKLASHAAKNIAKCQGVCVLDNKKKWDWMKKRTPVDNIWGISTRFAKRLADLNIYTALELANADPKYIRRYFNVCVERIIEELNGHACLSLDEIPNIRKQIYCSRSFANKTSNLQSILDATSLYVARACEKLRAQQSLCASIQVLLYCVSYENPLYNQQRVIQLPYPSNDTRLISNLARQVIKQIFKANIAYIKVGVGLLDLSEKKHQQLDLFHAGQAIKTDQLMNTMDKINQHYGKNSIYVAAEGVHKKWLMRQAYRSPSYTSQWDELPEVHC
ncbi:Y-family DNA polymerase [sulfur-oxidizing endosymbiont of Gigantopelta aegis]|uniref:Y-family DNA polymerase n=1 Tax=sulfur-oxidizing endosymbiont of Gigantopelta aegis TaxID=2794934 RepID=UPI0018DC0994|nr:Y-family DNA polymerase [sulfur-oxidizing endosymbiont of Gigantopelta aegis]